MKNSKFKTIISILISVILIFCCVSVVSFAEESSTYPKGWLSGSGDKEWFTQEYYTDNWLYYREDEETSYPKGLTVLRTKNGFQTLQARRIS